MKKIKQFIKKYKTKLVVIICLLFTGILSVTAATVIFSADEISFNKNTVGASGMTSTDLQGAIEELFGEALSCVNQGYIDENEEPRFIFTGKNPNNYIYIKENGVKVKYRIYSVERDGTMKVIRDESITTMVFDVNDATRRKGGYCTSNYCNAWAAAGSFTNNNTSLGVTGLGTNSGDSSIKEYIDNTYTPMLDDYSKIVAKTWNNSGTTYNRDTLENAIADEGKNTWNGKIALLTASEYVRANSNTETCGTLALLSSNGSTCKSTNYLFKSSSNWWLLTPFSGNRTIVPDAATSGSVDSNAANVIRGVRPVFYLCSGLTLTGKGTSGTPYEISGSCSS